jgi:hypothetical protein
MKRPPVAYAADAANNSINSMRAAYPITRFESNAAALLLLFLEFAGFEKLPLRNG